MTILVIATIFSSSDSAVLTVVIMCCTAVATLSMVSREEPVVHGSMTGWECCCADFRLNAACSRYLSFAPNWRCWGCDCRCSVCPCCGSPRTAAAKKSDGVAYPVENTLPLLRRGSFYSSAEGFLFCMAAATIILGVGFFLLLSMYSCKIGELHFLSFSRDNPCGGSGLPRTTFSEGVSAIGLDMTKLLTIEALCRCSLSSVDFNPDDQLSLFDKDSLNRPNSGLLGCDSLSGCAYLYYTVTTRKFSLLESLLPWKLQTQCIVLFGIVGDRGVARLPNRHVVPFVAHW
jgi:hypothetical protein